MSKKEQQVYMLQEREFIVTNQNIYKIGKTKNKILTRMNGYPKSSNLLIVLIVDDCNLVERELIKQFKIEFIQKPEYGTEYFEGDLNKMSNTFYKISQLYGTDNKVNTINTIINIEEANILCCNVEHLVYYLNNSLKPFIFYDQINRKSDTDVLKSNIYYNFYEYIIGLLNLTDIIIINNIKTIEQNELLLIAVHIKQYGENNINIEDLFKLKNNYKKLLSNINEEQTIINYCDIILNNNISKSISEFCYYRFQLQFIIVNNITITTVFNLIDEYLFGHNKSSNLAELDICTKYDFIMNFEYDKDYTLSAHSENILGGIVCGSISYKNYIKLINTLIKIIN